MIQIRLILILLLLGIAKQINAQSTDNDLDFKGQLSTFGSYNFDRDLEFLFGGNFIPEVSYSIPLPKDYLLDFNGAANLNGSFGFHPFTQSNSTGNLSAYRLWTRYSGNQFEARLGLQKINFGSASILRPLRWFDQVDPRDPLGITNGVWGLLGRYYFLDNTNIWAWVLYGNEDTKGWEQVYTNHKKPEFGGRVQWPVPKGEVAFTYHHRTADARNLAFPTAFSEIAENRFGFDGKWDITIGFWIETTHSTKTRNIGMFTNQTQFTVGTDYTFAVGNGLNIVAEHLFTSYDEKSFEFNNTQNLTAITSSYPIGIFDQISTVLYFDWKAENFYSFFNYQRDLKHFTFYTMVFINPKNRGGFQQNDLVNSYTSKGMQLMLVYNF